MNRQITITSGSLCANAELNSSPCAAAIYDSLPIGATANTWGDEVYFDIPVVCELQSDAREDVAVGEMGYWPGGQAFCIFFGPTPASGADGAPRAASRVNPIGRIIGDAAGFNAVRDGDEVNISAVS